MIRQKAFPFLLIGVIILGVAKINLPISQAQSNTLRINEILPNPVGSDKKGEFIELYNTGEKAINLKGWKIKDLVGKKENGKYKIYSLDKIKKEIKEHSFLTIYKKDMNLSLVNTQYDEIILLNNKGKEVDRVHYKKAQEAKSLSFENTKKKWQWTSFITPQAENLFFQSKKYLSTIRINEILPNPQGNEKKKEFIELYNYGEKDVNLKNWLLRDASKTGKYLFKENKIIKAKKYLTIYRSEFHFALNNSGEEIIKLINPNNQIVSQLEYAGSIKNIAYAFDNKSQKWRWTKYITPNQNNKFTKPVKIILKKDKKVYTNIWANFSFSVSNEKIRKDKYKVKWDFGDGHKSYLLKTKHKYQKEGKYRVKLNLFNGSEIIEKSFWLKVKKFPCYKVKITQVVPNPAGRDKHREYITIYNSSRYKLNLKGWSVATGSRSSRLTNHPIYKKFIIPAHHSRRLTNQYAHFILANKKTTIELRYPNGKVAYRLRYKFKNGKKNIPEEAIYFKKKGQRWQWRIKNNEEERTKNTKSSSTSIAKNKNQLLTISSSETVSDKESEVVNIKDENERSQLKETEINNKNIAKVNTEKNEKIF